ncbi:MAG: MFS transporter [Saprospiraceae bacterium]|nr:MFS transporter [Bacteroidia bacterium]NNE14833.1 MFS transporter [Saprospiraceae bacterium]NNL90608.1 MFS transporter [Saprospiraceae bacterium]
MIAIPWYFAQKDMLAYFGIVYMATTIISMFWMPISGSIVDKYDRKVVFLFITAIVGSLIGIITYLGFHLGDLPPLIVASVFTLTFLNYNIHYPCLYAFVQEIIEQKYYSRISSILEIIGQCTTIVSGAFATILLEGTEGGIFKVFGLNINVGFNISAWKIHEIFLIDSATYFVAFIIILMIKYTPLIERKPETGSIIKRLKIGLEYLWNNRPIFWFGVLSYSIFLAVLLEAFYLGVSYVNNHLNESGDVYSNSKMAYAMGAIFVGLTIRFLLRVFNIPIVIIIMTFLTSAIFLTLSFSNSIVLFFIMMFFIGIMNAGVRIARMTYLFKNVPNQYFGRSGSVFFFVNVLFRIVLMLIFTMTFFQTGNNIIYAYMIVGIILFLAALLMLKHLKSFDLRLTKS